eukprot:1138434-Pelagomonas_calceolata.AAC.6
MKAAFSLGPTLALRRTTSPTQDGTKSGSGMEASKSRMSKRQGWPSVVWLITACKSGNMGEERESEEAMPG